MQRESLEFGALKVTSGFKSDAGNWFLLSHSRGSELLVCEHVEYLKESVHSQRKRVQIGEVPVLQQLTSFEQCAMELAGGDGACRMLTDSQVDIQHATLDPEEPGPSGAGSPDAGQQIPQEALDYSSEGGCEESSEDSTSEAA